jgi:hypothetical protein
VDGGLRFTNPPRNNAIGYRWPVPRGMACLKLQSAAKRANAPGGNDELDRKCRLPGFRARPGYILHEDDDSFAVRGYLQQCRLHRLRLLWRPLSCPHSARDIAAPERLAGGPDAAADTAG